MKRPLWFRRDGRLHWTPCTWQGWGIVGGFGVFVATIMTQTAPKSPMNAVLETLCATAILIGIAVATDDTHQSAP